MKQEWDLSIVRPNRQITISSEEYLSKLKVLDQIINTFLKVRGAVHGTLDYSRQGYWKYSILGR